MCDEMNRKTADELAGEFSLCGFQNGKEIMADKIFTALQIAQSRGKNLERNRHLQIPSNDNHHPERG